MTSPLSPGGDLSEPFTNKPRRPRLRWGLVALALGGGVIASSFLLAPAWQAAVPVLSGIGVAVLLFLPLYWVQDRSYQAVKQVAVQQQVNAANVEQLSRAVEDVQEQIDATNLRLDEIGPATNALISDQRKADDGAVAAFLEAPSWQNTVNMLNNARRLKAVGASIGCQVGKSGRWLFFQDHASPARSSNFEPGLPVFLDFTETAESWHRGEEVQVFMLRVADALKRLGLYPSNDGFDATQIFKTLGTTVKTALDFRHDGRDVGALYVIVNHEWIITERGMESQVEHCVISTVDIRNRTVKKPPWVGLLATPERIGPYNEALAIAERFFRKDG